MHGSTLSLHELTRLEFLRQAQAPVQAIADSLDLKDVSPSLDSWPTSHDPGDPAGFEETCVQRDKNGLVIAISPKISQDHFDPYKMAVFASNEAQAVRLQAELQMWLDFASNEHESSREHLIRESHLFVEWLKSIANDHHQRIAHFEIITHLTGLVAQYCHPHASAELRAETLDSLMDLAKAGVDEAHRVVELLISPSAERMAGNELAKNKDFVDSPVTGTRLVLVEDSYEVQIKQLINYVPATSPPSSSLDRLVREAKLRDGVVKIYIVGCLKHIHSIFSLYVLSRYLVDMLEIPNVSIETGLIDTTCYIRNDVSYVRRLKRWFHESQQKIPSLGHLIKAAVNNDISEFQIKRGSICSAPSAEELVLFYLRMLAPKWNSKFRAILGSGAWGKKAVQRNYSNLIFSMWKLIPKEWQTAIDAHSEFSQCMKRERPKYSEALSTMSPVNLLTDNQLNQAGLIISTTQGDKETLERRFQAGVSGKIVLLSEISLERTNHNHGDIKLIYTPSTFFFNAKWNETREKRIETLLLRYLIPHLEQRISTEKIKAVRLVQQKQAAKEAIETVKGYVTYLQKQAMSGKDKDLINGLTFLSAVMEDIDPCSREWEKIVSRHANDREAANIAVFGNTTRTLSDASAIRFLTNYVGPKKYAEKEFPAVYQRYNDELLTHLVSALRNHSCE